MDSAHFDAPKAGFHCPAQTGRNVATRYGVAAASAAIDTAAHPTVVTADDEVEANATLRAFLAGAVRNPIQLQILGTKMHRL